MKVKLTLTVEEDVIMKAKEVAQAKRRSISDLVENYLKQIINKEFQNKSISISPEVLSLKGSIKVPPDLDYRDILAEELSKKYSK